MRLPVLALWTAGLCAIAGTAAAQAPGTATAQAPRPPAPSASAKPGPDGNKELARVWANKAKARFDAGDYKGAIESIHEAQKHATPPTFARLEAQAYEKLGQLVEAQRLYQSIVDIKLAADAPFAWSVAQEGAKKDLAALAPRVPKLTVVVAGVDLSYVTITLDGAPFATANAGKPVPLDPGSHEVVVNAPGRPLATKSADLREGAAERLEFVFEGGKVGPEPSTKPASWTLPPAATSIGRFVALGVGGAGLIVGAVTGGIVLGEKAEIEQACRLDLGKCSTRSKEGIESVIVLADVSTATLAVGGALAAAGALLLIVPRLRAGGAQVSVSPGFVSVRGAF